MSMRNKQLALKRVKEVASVAFAKRGFDKVTVGEIAARAHCSTATIYEIYGSKSELYFEVRRDKAKSVHIPMPRKVPNAKSLQSLLSYACDRIRSVSEIPDIQNYYKPPKRIDKKRLRGITRGLVRRATPLPTLKPAVEQAMQAGLLRRTDAEATAYLIWTALGWEAAMLGFLYDSEVEIDPAEVIRMVFTPLVTREGIRGDAGVLEHVVENNVAEQSCRNRFAPAA